jgi:hypothetical protein
MVPINKIIGVMSCGFVLCGLTGNAASAADKMKATNLVAARRTGYLESDEESERGLCRRDKTLGARCCAKV